MALEEEIKIANEHNKMSTHCEYCGHTIPFYAFSPDRKLCSWCKRYNYKNDKIKFKELLLKEIRR